MISPVLSICGRCRWRRAASHIRVSFIPIVAVPARPRRFVLLFARSIRAAGRGLSLFLVPLFIR